MWVGKGGRRRGRGQVGVTLVCKDGAVAWSSSDAHCLILSYLRAQQLNVVQQFHPDAGGAAGVVRQAVQVDA